MEYLPELQTEGLLLRAFTLADAAAVQRLCELREIADTTLHIPHPYSDGEAEKWIAGQAEDVRNGSQYVFAVATRENSILVGAVSLGVVRKHNKAELGYWIGVPYWGRGYATEAARRVLAFGFETLELNPIYSSYFARNPASRRVQEKAGMHYEGLFRQDALKNGRYEDVGQYGLTRDAYQAPPSI